MKSEGAISLNFFLYMFVYLILANLSRATNPLGYCAHAWFVVVAAKWHDKDDLEKCITGYYKETDIKALLQTVKQRNT